MSQDYVGLPFVDGGRDRDGCDCWGLVKLIYSEEYGIELPDFKISAFDIHGVATTMQREKATWTEVDQLDMVEGDVIAMHIGATHMGMVNHVGVYLGQGRFIHITKKTNAMVNRLTDVMWAKRILGVYRWEN